MPNENEEEAEVDASTFEPVASDTQEFGVWMTVQEAVTYCMSNGLPRTPKTVRKWAQRSIDSVEGVGEIAVQRQDTENGFRWLIGRESLDVKIEQEKELILRNKENHWSADTSEPVRTGVDTFEPVPINKTIIEPIKTHDNGSEAVSTALPEAPYALVELLKKQLDRTEQQLDVKDRQIDALLERDRETNVLIQGLQTSLTRVVRALPSAHNDVREQFNQSLGHGDNSQLP